MTRSQIERNPSRLTPADKNRIFGAGLATLAILGGFKIYNEVKSGVEQVRDTPTAAFLNTIDQARNNGAVINYLNGKMAATTLKDGTTSDARQPIIVDYKNPKGQERYYAAFVNPGNNLNPSGDKPNWVTASNMYIESQTSLVQIQKPDDSQIKEAVLNSAGQWVSVGGNHQILPHLAQATIAQGAYESQ